MKEKINKVEDPRLKPHIRASTIFYTIFVGICFQMKSMNQLKWWIKLGKLKKFFPKKTKMPGIDTIRRWLMESSVPYTTDILHSIVHQARKNGVFRKGAIKGHIVVAIDGVELFDSTDKCCDDCLTRTVKEVTHYFHKTVVCMSVGSQPRIILGMEMLYPKEDGSDKDEGEQTGAKRLVEKISEQFNHFADIIVVDALYLNQLFISLVLSKGFHVVVRMKDERLNLMKDAEGLFHHKGSNVAQTAEIGRQEVAVESWEDSFYFGDQKNIPVRVYRFRETRMVKGKEKTVDMWTVTTMNQENNAQVIWEIMHKRWDIENCGFRELNQKWSIKHGYVHHPNAIKMLVTIIFSLFNLHQLYFFLAFGGFLMGA